MCRRNKVGCLFCHALDFGLQGEGRVRAALDVWTSALLLGCIGFGLEDSQDKESREPYFRIRV